MSKREILVLFVLITISQVKSYVDVNMIVLRCIEESNRFHSKENIYVRKTPIDFRKPDFAGPEIEELQQKVYIREKAQRPFECITNNVPRHLYRYLKLSPAYKELACQCKRASGRIRCDGYSYKYRTIDGTCNNLQNLKWGSSLSELRRLLPANYRGASGFRQSECQKPLPDPRNCSLHISRNKIVASMETTQMLPFFGQALAHDLSDIATSFVGNKTINCCPKRRKPLHPQCSPILISNDDYFYSKHNITCMNVVRAAMYDRCKVGKRSQMSQATSYIDLSFVYGITDNMAKDLRDKENNGKLSAQNENNESLLPALYPFKDCDKDAKYYCFLAGDRRANMHTCIMAFHTLFLREHNRLVDELHKINPCWNGEKLYQEARKINIAQFQVVVYKEFLPVLLGEDLMTRYSLRISPNKYSFYNPIIDASLFVEFNTAAFRLHALLNGFLTKKEVEKDLKRINDIYQNVAPLYHNKISSLMHGLCQSPNKKYSRYVAEDVTNYLYKTFESNWGFDIVSANILRGRDVGLPTYTEIVRFLTNGEIDIQKFEDLIALMDEDNIKILEEVYCNVGDIDMWIGFINEQVPDSMMVGPTAAEIIATQFKNLKYGDRFYFEHPNNFNYDQLQSLKEVTLSSILCLNTHIKGIQINPFRQIDSLTNPIVDCKITPKLDLNLWRDPVRDICY